MSPTLIPQPLQRIISNGSDTAEFTKVGLGQHRSNDEHIPMAETNFEYLVCEDTYDVEEPFSLPITEEGENAIGNYPCCKRWIKQSGLRILMNNAVNCG